jgi:hypothetical protein
VQWGKGLESYRRQVAQALLSEQRTDIGKYFFVNRTIKIWNQLPAEVLGAFPGKPNTFRQRVRKAIINGVK